MTDVQYRAAPNTIWEAPQLGVDALPISPTFVTSAGVQSFLDALSDRAANENRVVILGVSGLDGAGKSTFAARAKQYYTALGVSCTTVSVDDFLHPKSRRYRNGAGGQSYYEDAFDLERIAREVLVPLQAHGVLGESYYAYNLSDDSYTSTFFQVRDPTVLIIEGVMIFRAPLLDFLDVKLWIDADRETCLRRAKARVRDIRHYGGRSNVAERFINRLYAGQMIHFESDAPLGRADCILSSELLAEQQK